MGTKLDSHFVGALLKYAGDLHGSDQAKNEVVNGIQALSNEVQRLEAIIEKYEESVKLGNELKEL